MDLLYSGAFVRAVSTGAVALYQHLGPAPHHLLRPIFGLCWNALGLGNELLALRHHYHPREVRNAHCWRLAPYGSPITFEVWSCQGTSFWYVVNPEGNGSTIGAAATETDAIREARSSIEEIARRACVAASPPADDASAIDESNLNPTASSLASSSWDQDVAADLHTTVGPLPRSANPDTRRSALCRDDRAADAQRPGQEVPTYRTTRR
jgi:hypothetical protein